MCFCFPSSYVEAFTCLYVFLCNCRPAVKVWSQHENACLFIDLFFKDFIYFYTEGRGERKRGRETSMRGCLMHPLLGAWSSIQAYALTGNRTGDPLVHRSALKSTEPHRPGLLIYFIYLFIFTNACLLVVFFLYFLQEKITKFNTCMDGNPHTWESRRPMCRRGSQIETMIGVCKTS